MNSLGLFSLLASFLLVPLSFAQQQSRSYVTNDDDAIVQLWNAHEGQTDRGWLEGDRLVISSDSDLKTCWYLRVYRVKRETKKSDVTAPSGYTTCVVADRFNKKSTGEPKLELIPQP